MTVPGFYNGDGTYRIRFSPATQGEWTLNTWNMKAKLLDLAKPGDFAFTVPHADYLLRITAGD